MSDACDADVARLSPEDIVEAPALAEGDPDATPGECCTKAVDLGRPSANPEHGWIAHRLQAGEMPELSPHSRTARSVLVVEDEPPVCELVAEILCSDGFETHAVRTDAEAYQALRTQPLPYDFMIVDVNLGSGTTGYDVARFARQIAPALRVIYLSGQTSEDSFKANGVPGSLFLAKPFTPTDLIGRVHTLVGDNEDAS